ncbi:putative pentatricopeptide repeat-containing protein At3g13770, mitochondrial [Quercus suber]
MEHYTCMVDLLARAGHLTEAYNFVERMPIKPEARLLTALFSSCCSHMNVELAKTVGQRLIELEPEEAGAYMLLSNFYGIIGDLEAVANVRKLMSKRGIRKTKACTWIEIDRKVHSFESGDGSHPLNKEIYSYLKDLVKKMKNIGYVPNTSMVMQNVDDHTKEEMVLSHSEKLAITLGLIITPLGTRIMIVKNLKVYVQTAIYLLHLFQRLKEGRLSREILADFIISIMDHALVEIIGRGMGGSLP